MHKKKDEHESPSILWSECRRGVFNTQLLQNPVIRTYQVKLEKQLGFLKLIFWNYTDQKLFSYLLSFYQFSILSVF